MSMFDDLDPMFEPSAEAALENVATRVHALRLRRRVTIASAFGAFVVVTALTSAAFASNGNRHSARVSITNEVTSTTETPTTEPDLASSTTVSTDTTTTVTTTTIGTVPVVAPTDSTPPPTDTTTTTVPPADLHFAFDQSRIVVQSGSTATVSYTVTNDGDGPGQFGEPACPFDEFWPPDAPRSWPAPVSERVYCAALTIVTIGPHESKTFHHTLVAGKYDGDGNNVVPAPAGETTYVVVGIGPSHTLPVTITAPAQVPFSSTFPSHVTVASGATHTETFTLTNRLAFPVSYRLEGPCMRLEGSTTGCNIGTLMQLDRLWTNDVVVGANATVTLTMELSATDPHNANLPPGTYQFHGPGGMPLTLTVTP